MASRTQIPAKVRPVNVSFIASYNAPKSYPSSADRKNETTAPTQKQHQRSKKSYQSILLKQETLPLPSLCSPGQDLLLPALPNLRQCKPATDHTCKKANANGMQHPRAHLLREQSREKRRDRTPGAAQRAHGGQTTHLQPLRDEFGEDGGGAGIDGTEEETDEGDGDGLADDVGDEPDEELERGGADDEGEDGFFLADLVGRVGEEEAAEGDAAPEAGGDVADTGGGRVPVGDQEGDDPAGDGDFGALVGEDEEGAEDGGFVPQCLFEHLPF